MARRRGRLTPEDRALWEKVARTAEPMHRRTASKPPSPEAPAPLPAAPRPPRSAAAPPPPPPASETRIPRTVKPAGRTRAPSVTLPPPRPALDELDPAAGLDRRTAERLRKGRRPPEARLDLHGMTAERAHAALGRFLRQSRAEGKRLVLVVTGKGGRRPAADAPWMPERTGVLRHSVPQWLETGPLAGMVVGVYAAHRSHGGDGAVYIYLRKSR